jgi:hypothetical protein
MFCTYAMSECGVRSVCERKRKRREKEKEKKPEREKE